MQAQTGVIEGGGNSVGGSETFSEAMEDVIDDEEEQQYTESMPDSEEEAFDTMYQACIPLLLHCVMQLTHP